MIKSMTGFGKSTGEINKKKITVELKSLNSKQADIFVRMPSVYKEKELPLRSLVNKSLQRGKIEVNLYVELLGEDSSYTFNTDLFRKYYAELKGISDELGESSDLFTIVSKLPDVLKSERVEIDDEEWNGILGLVEEAIGELNDFRLKEGSTLKGEFESRVKTILSLLKEVEGHEPARIEVVKTRILGNLKEAVGEEKIDKDRFEQELIYYLEKYDISEEKSRLLSHCEHFNETMDSGKSEGKKLGFIAQEMGREINTLGSKANYADIQKIVVQMKDELEKIKEQILNVL